MISRVYDFFSQLFKFFVIGFLSLQSLKAQFPTSAFLDTTKRAKPEQIFSRPSLWADAVLNRMTIEEKIGQLFAASCSSVFLPSDNEQYQRVLELIRAGKVGGVMLMKGDVYSAAMLVNRLQRNARFPLLISADMEWGATMRIDRATEFPVNMGIAATWNPLFAYKAGQITAREAHAMGIHHNYAPSVDLNNNPSNPIINTRSFGENIELTNAMADAYILGTQSQGILATVKHFPGHGDTEIDSHKDLPILKFSRGRLDSIELKPFRSAIKNGVMSIMVGHLAVPAITGSEKIPASLSKLMVDSLLRKALNFQGLIVTDGMRMAGVRKFYSAGEAAIAAIDAGIDIILDSPDITEAYASVLSAVQIGRISEERINESARRILVAKEWLKLHEQRFANLETLADIVGNQSSISLSQEIAENALTALQLEKKRIPLAPKTTRRKRKMLNISISNSSISNYGEAFYTAFKNSFAYSERIRIDKRSNKMDFDETLKEIPKSAAVVVSCYADIRSFEGKYGFDGELDNFLKRLIKSCNAAKTPVILISFGTPYLILAYPEAPTYLIAYSSARACEQAAVRWLKGEVSAKGKLPVKMSAKFPFGKESIQTVTP
ncbi:MAG: glycoside hydrolase family 3 N-terminal domain-containing protein [Chloroherpetonaceae bacterium]|nr:glycoside hydrolase family 3 N-terminal domain-containing protein [Chloroherpetonaceae bacterium]